MDVREAPLSDDPHTRALVIGPIWASNALTFSFPTTAAQFTGYSGGEPASGFEMLNAVQQAAVEAMLASIATFANLTFTELTGADAGSAVLRFGMTDGVEAGVLAHAYIPDPSELGGDAWFRNTGGENDNPVRGNDAWHTFLHEIGHTLGLGHPHEANPPMAPDRDDAAYTVMSYDEPHDSIGEWRFPQSYMIEDIAALQFLYGANYAHNSSDSTYQWDALTGEMLINGVGQGAPGGNRVFQTVWDGGGIDTYDLSNIVIDTTVFYNPTFIDLNPGAYVYLRAQGTNGPLNASIYNPRLLGGDARSLIENAIGTSGRDVIRGNDAPNHLDGGGGSDGWDELYGFGGDDVLVGVGQLVGGDGNDTLSGGGSLAGGTGDDLLHGADSPDWLSGDEGDDTLFGGGENDSLKGNAGRDALQGEAGNDTLEGGEDVDAVDGGGGSDKLYGGAGNDSLTGGDGNDRLDGEDGNDLLIGGLGDDTYVIVDESDQIVELDGEGIDTIQTRNSFVLPGTIENLSADPDIWNALSISLTGNASNNAITGNWSANAIDGGAGADTMSGGGGDDTFYVDNPNDRVIEYFGGGIDTVHSSVSYRLPPTPPVDPNYDPYAGASLIRDPTDYALEKLILTGSANLNGTGSEIANTIQGNSGNNTLDGMQGADTLVGLGGDDWFYVDNAGDSVIEAAAGGAADRIFASLTYALGADVHVEILSTSNGEGTAAIGLTGNDLANTVFGNAGDNALDGKGGNDWLVGGLGSDTMAGGTGDDLYYVDSLGDAVFEAAGEGAADGVLASISYTLAAALHVERLSTNNDAGTAALNLTGNALANTIYGNAGANILDGKAGADQLVGLGGDDSYFVDSGADAIFETAGNGASDRVFAGVSYALGAAADVERMYTNNNAGTAAINLTGNGIANIIYGNAGNNVLDGKGGADQLAGLGGDDWYHVDSAADVIFESGGNGANDRVIASVSYALAAGAEVERMHTIDEAATTAINLTGSAIANVIYGNAGANILDGKAGADTLVGRGGDDSYYVDSGADAIIETAGGGHDRVFAGVSYALGSTAEVERMYTTNNAGTAAINLTGNGLANTIYGNAGANILDGKGGADTLVGLAGTDVFAFTTALGAGNVDVIGAFSVPDDRIHLENAVFTGLAAGALAAGAFNTGASASQADDRVIYNSASGALLFDADGVGGAAGVQFASLSAGLAMTSADFFVI